jgi:hypothetical protein
MIDAAKNPNFARAHAVTMSSRTRVFGAEGSNVRLGLPHGVASPAVCLGGRRTWSHPLHCPDDSPSSDPSSLRPFGMTSRLAPAHSGVQCHLGQKTKVLKPPCPPCVRGEKTMRRLKRRSSTKVQPNSPVSPSRCARQCVFFRRSLRLRRASGLSPSRPASSRAE